MLIILTNDMISSSKVVMGESQLVVETPYKFSEATPRRWARAGHSLLLWIDIAMFLVISFSSPSLVFDRSFHSSRSFRFSFRFVLYVSDLFAFF